MKNHALRILAATVSVSGGLAAFCCLQAWAAPVNDNRPKPTAADNSGVNRRDRDQSEPTADQAKNNHSDLQLMREIRRTLAQDKSLSLYAHNVKIIAKRGKVTLKGPVKTQAEKEKIGAQAEKAAGADNVNNLLVVKGT